MTVERLAWVLSGISMSKLNKLEKALIKRIEKKQPEDLTAAEEANLERIYRFRGK